MKNIEALIADGGDITLGAIYPIECAATAANHRGRPLRYLCTVTKPPAVHL